jgi:hypothetical protein
LAEAETAAGWACCRAELDLKAGNGWFSAEERVELFRNNHLNEDLRE